MSETKSEAKKFPTLSIGRRTDGHSVCAEQAVSWLVSGQLTLGAEDDHPSCVQPVLSALTIYANDALPDGPRQELWPIILRQAGTTRPEMEPQLSADLAAFVCSWAAQRTEGPAREALEAAAAVLADPSEENRRRAAEAAWAAWAAWAACLLECLNAVHDEAERLTGHEPVDLSDRLTLLCELVK